MIYFQCVNVYIVERVVHTDEIWGDIPFGWGLFEKSSTFIANTRNISITW